LGYDCRRRTDSPGRRFVSRDDLHWLPHSSANNVQAVYHCLQDCPHRVAASYRTEMCVPVAASTGRMSSFSSTWRSDGAQNENDNVIMDHAVLQSPDHVSRMICHRLCVHHLSLCRHSACMQPVNRRRQSNTYYDY